VGTNQTMITIFFIGHKSIVLGIVPKGTKFNQLYFVDYIFSGLNRENAILIVGFRRRLLDTYGQFNPPQWIKNCIKFEKDYVSRLPHLHDSPAIRLCDFWLFGMLKRVLKDRKFNLSDEIEEAIMEIGDELTFDEVQGVFHNRMIPVDSISRSPFSISLFIIIDCI
jgi:hypothetical protein